MSWTVLFTKQQAQKDARKLASASPALKQKAQALLDILAVDSYQQPPPYEALVGDLRGTCSRRINIQHRLVAQVLEEEQIVKVLRLWSHYEKSARQQEAETGHETPPPRSCPPSHGLPACEMFRLTSWHGQSAAGTGWTP